MIVVEIHYQDQSGDYGLCSRDRSISTYGYPEGFDYGLYAAEVGSVKELLELFEEFNVEPGFRHGEILWEGRDGATAYSLHLSGISGASQMRIARYLARIDYAGELSRADFRSFVEWYCERADLLKGGAMTALFNLVMLSGAESVALHHALQILTLSEEFAIWQIFHRNIQGAGVSDE